MTADQPAPSASPRPHRAGRWILGAILLGLLFSMIVFVDETESVVIARFGRIVAVYDRPELRGLQFKWPWPLETARRFDRRLQILTPAGREAFTRDRKNVTVEAYIVWRIGVGNAQSPHVHPVIPFLQSFGSFEVAEARLATRLQSILTEQIGRRELGDLVQAASSEAGPPEDSGALAEVSRRIREELNQRSDESDSILARYGIEIVDVRIRRLNLPAGNMRAVFERMRSERQKIAERYRSVGMAENRMIRSRADRQAGELLARAQAEAERIRGAGEAEALKILNEAHARDPEFAMTLQTLETYQKIFNERTTLVLSASSRLLRLLVDGIPSAESEPRPALPAASTATPSRNPTPTGLDP